MSSTTPPPPTFDWKSRYFFVTTSVALLATFTYAFTTFFHRNIAALSFKVAMLAANLAMVYRVYYSTPYPTFSLTGMKAWLASFVNTNNFQYCVFCFLFTNGQPIFMALAPLMIHCAYQWMTIVDKQFGTNRLWEKFGKDLYAKAQLNMEVALILCASLEIGLWLFLMIEMITPARNPLRIILYLNFLRLRYRCTDNTVLRMKFTSYNTKFYHEQIWNQLGEKLAPVLNFKFIQPGFQFVKKWFTGGY